MNFQSLEKRGWILPMVGSFLRGFSNDWKKRRRTRAFTLVELLAVLAIVSVLAALLFPALSGAQAASRQSRCASNIRQLYLANTLYASDQRRYAPAAADIREQNLKRWHGLRDSEESSFDGLRGPLFPYLGDAEGIRSCPAMLRVNGEGFEAGCGGYGYNVRGVGSQSYEVGTYEGQERGMVPSAIRHPGQTVMFADTAFPQTSRGRRFLIEYSFAEAYYHLGDSQPKETYVADPSIHFRHGGEANVAWCDGHVSAETMAFSSGAGSEKSNIGWFGGRNNELFDPF